MITAVDLLRGIAALVGWERIEVPGATGYLDTDYAAKGRAGVEALKKYDIVCVHVEASDEASHEGRCDEKVKAIEEIDQHVVGPLVEALEDARRLADHDLARSPDVPADQSPHPRQRARGDGRHRHRRRRVHKPTATRTRPSRSWRSTKAGMRCLVYRKEINHRRSQRTRSRKLSNCLHLLLRALCVLSWLNPQFRSYEKSMSLIVQKFGGTSVANAEKIRVAARRAIRAQQDGNQVVMVVSAMGHQTDVLVDLAKQITDDPSGREMDMLLSTGEQVSVALMAMAIHSLGAEAVSLTGAQIGIRTDSSHTKARIQSISTERMKKLLDDGKIVIAAGFQGIDEDFNITTLGRGGSDTTAVALAAVLNADACEIYTDVDGVFTTDPRLVAEARKMDRVSHDEMLELASLGAGVMHSRSIEFGKKFNVPIHVCNSASFSDEPGTIIGSESEVGRPGRERRRPHQERGAKSRSPACPISRARATRFSRSSPASTWRST